MKRCVGVQFLNDCEYAVLLANGYGCRNQGDCEYQRPRVPVKISSVTKMKLEVPEDDNGFMPESKDGEA